MLLGIELSPAGLLCRFHVRHELLDGPVVARGSVPGLEAGEFVPGVIVLVEHVLPGFEIRGWIIPVVVGVWRPEKDLRDADLVRDEEHPVLKRGLEAGLAIAQCLVAILNGPEVDPGTAWEVGYAYPRGIPILGYVDDLRAAAGPNPVDMMVSQSCTAIVRTLPALATALRGIHRRLAQAA